MKANFNNPLPRTGAPRFNESSRQRSLRDSDSIPRQWIKHGDMSKQIFELGNMVSKLQKDIARMKKFGAGSSEGFVKLRGQYDPTLTDIETGDLFVARYSDYGANAGTYICIKDAPTASNLPWNDDEFWIQISKNDTIGRWA